MLILFGIFTVSCKTSKDFDSIKIKYIDSSVPPKYQRSYTFFATENSIRLTVDSYGNILNDTTITITKIQFNEIRQTVESSNLKIQKEKKNNGCTGGTAREIVLFKNNTKVFEGHTYFCGGTTYGNLSGDIESVFSKFKNLFDNFEQYLK
ncbi:MAG: hypothetical protein WHW07_02350 [Bacteroidales bacterium]|jgi:hypothetical protein|nr:hypothetical protein [Bacteroidales bacterium]HOL98756.1 hypothetical protein [Bacteroidales bacterium]HOM36197.1 hypothetical protein [Bacteroidales bacterium]HPD23513.1 hypothetical protein [Bacteroidales bacterium]HRS99645.1 hypothetical protein [Bacteroidales bacterium]